MKKSIYDIAMYKYSVNRKNEWSQILKKKLKIKKKYSRYNNFLSNNQISIPWYLMISKKIFVSKNN